MNQAIIRQSENVPRRATRRPGLFERRLLTAEDTTYQNIILVDCEPGATVEYHRIRTSESLYILDGKFELELDGTKQAIAPGDIVHFPADSFHGLRCLELPGKFLAVFAPTDGAAIQ